MISEIVGAATTTVTSLGSRIWTGRHNDLNVTPAILHDPIDNEFEVIESENPYMDRRTHLKIKIKSLAEEARIIRKEEQRAYHELLRSEMHQHRVVELRRVARNTLLAYGFIRGRTYLQVELWASTPPNWDAVRTMVRKYGAVDHKIKKAQLEALELWIKDAEVYLKDNKAAA